MTRLEKARIASEEAEKRAAERKKEYEELLKAEEQKVNKLIIDVVKNWADGLSDHPSWEHIPDRLKEVLLVKDGKESGYDNNINT